LSDLNGRHAASPTFYRSGNGTLPASWTFIGKQFLSFFSRPGLFARGDVLMEMF
jgi:hypothetical protein